jgi:COP9 signalosome complex subunit 4
MENLTRSIDAAISSRDFASLSNCFTIGWRNVGQGEQRTVAAHFIVQAVQTPNFLDDTSIHVLMDVFLMALSHLPNTVEGAADNILRTKIFEHKISSDDPDYIGAARVLAGMRMQDEGVYAMSAAQKTDIYVKIAECFLAEDEIAESDAAVNKAGVVVEQIANKDQHTALILRYKSTYARVLDANRKFLAAASRYHELSSPANGVLIDDEELMVLLGKACTCAILAPSGSQRQRVLGNIANDTRLAELERIPEFSSHAKILKKMYTQQILRKPELVQFEASLAEHQKAIMADGLTIMERGIVEHNMVAIASIYQSIYFDELAHLLGVSDSKAEQIAASMIMDGSLDGVIDQTERLLEFVCTDTLQEMYDGAVSNFCMELNRVTDAINTNVP